MGEPVFQNAFEEWDYHAQRARTLGGTIVAKPTPIFPKIGSPQHLEEERQRKACGPIMPVEDAMRVAQQRAAGHHYADRDKDAMISLAREVERLLEVNDYIKLQYLSIVQQRDDQYEKERLSVEAKLAHVLTVRNVLMWWWRATKRRLVAWGRYG